MFIKQYKIRQQILGLSSQALCFLGGVGGVRGVNKKVELIKKVKQE
jgi:hypothetical protein